MEDVTKHGNHDQSSHGRRAGAGSVGAPPLKMGREATLAEKIKRGGDAYYKQKAKGVTYKDMERDYNAMEEEWRKKDIGDPQDLADAQFFSKYGASLLDVATFVHGSNLMLEKAELVAKHGNHDQSSHGRWAKDDSEGEFVDTEGLHPKHRWKKDDSEGEFADTEWQDVAAMDEMDILNPPKPESYYQARAKQKK